MAQTVDDAKDTLTRTFKYSGAAFHVALFDPAKLLTTTFTAATTGILTFASGTLVDGMKVRLTTTGTLPVASPALSSTTDYYLRDTSGLTAKLALTPGGTAIALTTTGSGTHTATEQAPDATASLAVWARLESTYQGTGRQAVSFSASNLQTDYTNKKVYLDGQLATFTPNTGSVAYRWVGLVADGNATYQNTTGRIKDIADLGSSTIANGSSFKRVVTPTIQYT